jgi:hypothetical protein
LDDIEHHDTAINLGLVVEPLLIDRSVHC